MNDLHIKMTGNLKPAKEQDDDRINCAVAYDEVFPWAKPNRKANLKLTTKVGHCTVCGVLIRGLFSRKLRKKGYCLTCLPQTFRCKAVTLDGNSCRFPIHNKDYCREHSTIKKRDAVKNYLSKPKKKSEA